MLRYIKKRSYFRSVSEIILLYIIIIPVGFLLCLIGGVVFGSILILVISALFSHIILFSSKKIITKAQIKSIDYIIVVTALAGISGLTDIQDKIFDFASFFAEQALSLREFRSDNLSSELDDCMGDTAHTNPIDECKELYETMTSANAEKEVAETYVQKLKERPPTEIPTLRIIGFFMLLVGIGIRISKTTAEIYEWHTKA